MRLGVQTTSEHHLPRWGIKPTVLDHPNVLDLHALTCMQGELSTRRCAALVTGQADICRTRSSSLGSVANFRVETRRTLNMNIGTQDQAITPIEFDCKGGCGLKVRYPDGRRPVIGVAFRKRPLKRKGNPTRNNPSDTSVPSFVAYLTCAEGHVF